MASFMKYQKSSIVNQLRHNERTIQYPQNVDIDKSRTHLNYSLLEDPRPSYERFRSRLSELSYIRTRADAKLLCGWIITAPQELKTKNEKQFFQSCYDFLIQRYGENNCIQAIVHKDEAGRPHLHFSFIPVVVNNNKVRTDPRQLKVLDYKNKHPELSGRQIATELKLNRSSVAKWLKAGEPAEQKAEKVSAAERINKIELQSFHKDLQKFLNSQGLNVNVNSGITKENGGNISVETLKQVSNLQKNKGVNF